ncbi:MAG: hypothetical protein HYY17_08400 [Planctomycetes bacterium]|nr:hypothetical protein [Planctomycetota bacterium]
MIGAVNFVRSAVALLAGFLWAMIAIFNGTVAWREFVRKEKGVRSMVPLVGGFVAYAAVRMWPWEGDCKWAYFLSALLLDFGCLPYLALALLVMCRNRRR